MMTLYGVMLSPFVRKTILALELKGLSYQQELVIPYQVPADFHKISPLNKVPALVDGDVAIADSNVITEYLDEQYSQYPLQPSDPILRAKSRWIVSLASGILTETAIVGIYRERVIKPMLLDQPCNEEKVSDTIENKMPAILDLIEQYAPQENFIFEKIGIADLSLLTIFISLGYANYTIDKDKWAKLAAYIARMMALPIVQQQMEKERELLNTLGLKE